MIARAAFYVPAAGDLQASYAHTFGTSITLVLTVASGNYLLFSGSSQAFGNVILVMIRIISHGTRDAGSKELVVLFIHGIREALVHFPPEILYFLDRSQGHHRGFKKFVKVYSLIKDSDISEMAALKTHTR